jgi:hypothetical protein
MGSTPCKKSGFFGKPLRYSKSIGYDACLFGRDDKRQDETAVDVRGRLAQLVERIPYKD